MNSNSESNDVTVGRGKIYYWFARFFLLSPTYQDLIRALHPQFLNILETSLSEEARQPLEHLTEFAAKLDTTATDQLRDKYYELFSIPIKGKYIPPYESCFRERIAANTSGYGEIWNAASMKIKDFYIKNGFEPKTENTPPDHIGIELLFMSKMCELEAITEKRNEDYMTLRKKELKFLSEHLYAWLPHFTQDLKGIEGSGFYANLAELTKIFVEHDMNYLVGTRTRI